MLTRKQLLDLDEAVDTATTVKQPGEVITDIDGTPTAVTATTTMRAAIYGVTVTANEVAAAGLTPIDLPNLNIINEGETHD